MFCSKCGQSLPEGALFCAKCGSRIAETPQDTPTVFWQPYPAPNYTVLKKKSHAVLIAVLIGVLVIAAVLCVLLLLKVFPAGPAAAPHATGKAEETLSPSASASVKPEPAPSETPAPAVTTPPLPTETPEPSVAPTPSVEPTPSAELTVPGDIASTVSYFCEIALTSQNIGDKSNGFVKRWESPIKVEVRGDYTKEDYAVLAGHIDTLNAMGSLPKITIVKSGGYFVVSFVKLKEMADAVPGYVEGDWGSVTISWDSSLRIYKGYAGIATDVTNQAQRNHLILEQITQGLGLMNKSPEYTDSIFQSEWTEIQELSVLDYQIIGMLYNPVLKTGMTKEQASAALVEWLNSFE